MARVRPGLLAIRHSNSGETYIPLDADTTTLGRSEACNIIVPDPRVSRLHARIELQHNHYVLFDAGSFNGTFVNGKRIDHAHQLSTNDIIWLGSSDAALTFSDPEETVGVTVHGRPDPLLIDEGSRIVQVYGVPIQLTTLEYDLLVYLAGNPRKVCTREECFLAVWGQPYDPATCEDALNACVARLRRNLRATAEHLEQEPPHITTIKRVGFRLDSDVVFRYSEHYPTLLRERALGT
jgi:DNA-binding winged helix-turn-helix (wHTH) protein